MPLLRMDRQTQPDVGIREISLSAKIFLARILPMSQPKVSASIHCQHTGARSLVTYIVTHCRKAQVTAWAVEDALQYESAHHLSTLLFSSPTVLCFLFFSNTEGTDLDKESLED